MTGAPAAKPAAISSRVFAALLGVALITWLPRMCWGFWVDEAGTYWMACRGLRAAIGRTMQFSGQSLLYSVLVSVFCTAGPIKEFLLRLPSLAGIIVGAFLLYRLAERMLGAGAGPLAALVLVSPAPMVEAATEARPYALAVTAVIGAAYALFEWIESGRRRALAAYTLSAILVLYFHYLFGFALAVFALYVLIRKLPARRLGEFAAAEIAVLASLIPLRAHIENALGHPNFGAKAVLPGLLQLGVALFPPEIMIGAGLGLALLLALYTRSVGRPGAIPPASVFLIVSWAFLGTAVFFAAVHVTGASLFASRYLLFEMPGFALLVAWLGTSLRDRKSVTIFCLAIFSASALNVPNLIQLWQGSAREWRTPLAIARQADAPTFVSSGLVESNSEDWQRGTAGDSYLFAPLSAYPLREPILPLPYFLNGAGTANVRAALNEPLGDARRLVLLSRSGGDAAPWFEHELSSRGYRAKTLYDRELVVVEFDRD